MLLFYFIHQSDTLFSSKLQQEVFETTDRGGTCIESVKTDSIKEKFKKFNVEGEFQVSVLSKIVEVSGAGAFLTEERKSAKTQSMSLIYRVNTVHEELMIRQNKDKIDLDILKHWKASDATHVVVGIDWGAVCSVTCEYEQKRNEDIFEVKGALKRELEQFKRQADIKLPAEAKGSNQTECKGAESAGIDSKGSTKASDDQMKKDEGSKWNLTGCVEGYYKTKNEETHNKFTYKCNADVSDPDKDLPTTFEGAVELARRLPSLVKGKNNGKGVPLNYLMISLSAIAKMCEHEIQLDVLYKTIDEDITLMCAQVTDKITKETQHLNDIRDDLYADANFVPDERLANIDDELQRFHRDETGFKVKLKTLVKEIKSGKADISKLETFLSTTESETFASSKLIDQRKGFQKDLKKVTHIQSLQKDGYIYIGKREQLEINMEKNAFVLYKTSDENEQSKTNWEFFTRLQTEYHNYESFIVDQSLRDDLWPSNLKETTIHKFVNGTQTSTDLYSDETQDMEICLIRQASKPIHQQMRPKPTDLVNVKLPCPNYLYGNRQCQSGSLTWNCSKCKQTVEYHIKNKLFYCKCGESVPGESLWRCNNKKHGRNYLKYPDGTIIYDQLPKLLWYESKLFIVVVGGTTVVCTLGGLGLWYFWSH